MSYVTRRDLTAINKDEALTRLATSLSDDQPFFCPVLVEETLLNRTQAYAT